MAGADEALNIATWLAGLIGLAEEGVPVLKNTNQHTHINEVKGIIGPGPFLIAVLEFELDVGRYPRRLNGVISVPITSALGKSSAKSLDGRDMVSVENYRRKNKGPSNGWGETYIAHRSVPAPISTTF